MKKKRKKRYKKRKLANINISVSYMIILALASTFIMTCYFSYAWFQIQSIQRYSIITGNLSGTIEINSNKVDVIGKGSISYTPLTDDDTVSITVTNTSDRNIKNSIYYYTDSASDINIGYASDTSAIPTVTGIEIEKDGQITYKLKITRAKDKTINFITTMGLVNSDLKTPDNYTAIDEYAIPVATQLLYGVGDYGTLDKTDSEQTFITGTDPNNYIWYSGKLWRAVSIDPSDNSVKLVTQWNITTTQYSTATLNTYKNSYMEQWLNDTSVDGFLGNLRDSDNFIKEGSWNATMTEETAKPESTTMISSMVGLLNVYEYTMSYKNTTFENGYLNNGLMFWALNPYDSMSISYIDYSGEKKSSSPTGTYGVRPAINLKNTVSIVDGNGTVDNPYRLKGDNDKQLTSVKLSTRYSGEYISFGTGENNLYQIVSHENKIGTKITSASPLKLNNSYKSLGFGSNSIFSSSNIIGTFLNNDYLTNETYLTSDQVNMIEDDTTWYLGIIGRNTNYKLAKYTNTSATTLTSSVANSKIGLLRYGELMTGQFETSDSNNDYWILSPYSTSKSRSITYNSSGDNCSPGTSLGIKPVMNLKENVIITSGDGSRNNPFQIKLED